MAPKEELPPTFCFKDLGKLVSMEDLPTWLVFMEGLSLICSSKDPGKLDPMEDLLAA